MKHFAEGFLDKLKPFGSDKNTLEIGCGDGARSAEIASIFSSLTGIDPDPASIEKANRHNRFENRRFLVGVAENLEFPDASFELVIFPLSFHHIPIDKMHAAIAEATRVLKEGGYIIFIEPTYEGTFIDAEILYGCCDGDERKEKAMAYYSMLASDKMIEVAEFNSESIFAFDSKQDFFENIAILAGTEAKIIKYLEINNFKLSAKRRVNVFRKPNGE